MRKLNSFQQIATLMALMCIYEHEGRAPITITKRGIGEKKHFVTSMHIFSYVIEYRREKPKDIVKEAFHS